MTRHSVIDVYGSSIVWESAWGCQAEPEKMGASACDGLLHDSGRCRCDAHARPRDPQAALHIGLMLLRGFFELLQDILKVECLSRCRVGREQLQDVGGQ